jgi:hypothetical protein
VHVLADNTYCELSIEAEEEVRDKAGRHQARLTFFQDPRVKMSRAPRRHSSDASSLTSFPIPAYISTFVTLG